MEKNISKIEVIYIAGLPEDWLRLAASCWQTAALCPAPAPQLRRRHPVLAAGQCHLWKWETKWDNWVVNKSISDT